MSTPEFVKLARERGFYSEELMKKVAEHGSVRDVEEVPDDVRSVWVTSHDTRWSGTSGCRPPSGTPRWESPRPSICPTRRHPRTWKTPIARPTPELQGDSGLRDGSRDAQVLSTGKTGGEKPTMTPASSEAPTAPPVTPPAGAKPSRRLSPRSPRRATGGRAP